MRDTVFGILKDGRVRTGPWGSDDSDGLNGAFQITGAGASVLRIIANTAEDPAALGWEHVSVSLEDRCPVWEEMAFVKALFWRPDECVVQFHPPEADYVNHHPFCLHMWRDVRTTWRMPPTSFVGPKT